MGTLRGEKEGKEEGAASPPSLMRTNQGVVWGGLDWKVDFENCSREKIFGAGERERGVLL